MSFSYHRFILENAELLLDLDTGIVGTIVEQR